MLELQFSPSLRPQPNIYDVSAANQCIFTFSNQARTVATAAIIALLAHQPSSIRHTGACGDCVDGVADVYDDHDNDNMCTHVLYPPPSHSALPLHSQSLKPSFVEAVSLADVEWSARSCDLCPSDNFFAWDAIADT